MTQNEYATLIFYWGFEPHPERIEEILSTFENSGWARTEPRALATAGAVQAFVLTNPENKATWMNAHPALFRFVERAVELTPPEREQWNDYHVVTWLITRAESSLDKLLDRVAEGGTVGFKAGQHIEHWCEHCKPFKRAMIQAQKARREAMLIQ